MRNKLKNLGAILLLTFCATIFIYSFYLCGIAFLAWQDPSQLHPPITEGWNIKVLENKRLLAEQAKPEIEKILNDDSKSQFAKVSEISNIQLTIASMDTPAKKSFLDSIKFAWHYSIDTSIAGGIWKIPMIFFFLLILTSNKSFRESL